MIRSLGKHRFTGPGNAEERTPGWAGLKDRFDKPDSLSGGAGAFGMKACIVIRTQVFQF